MVKIPLDDQPSAAAEELVEVKASTNATSAWPPKPIANWLCDVDTRPDPEWIIKNLLPYDATVIISGAPKRAFKTWLAFWIALIVAAGKCLIKVFEPVKPLNVLVIELEGPAKQTANRWRWLANGLEMEIPESRLYMLHRHPVLLDNMESVRIIIDFVKAHNVKLLIIDTLAKAMQGDENKTKDVGVVMRNLDRLRRAMDGGTVIYLHHLRKPDDEITSDIDDDIRGSSALAGFYDAHYAIRRKNKHQDWLDLTIRQNNEAERYFKLWWDISRREAKATLRVEEFDPENLSAEIISYCIGMLLPNHDYSNKGLSEAWKVPMENLVPIRDELLSRGIIERRHNDKFRLVENPQSVKKEEGNATI